MSCKSFNICVVLNISDVTCPGVWICPKGMVCLDIWLFGFNSSTSFVEPKFPLAFHETFSFHENFAELTNLKDIQDCLEEKSMRIALIQVYEKKQVTLATYSSNVDEVLYPERSRLSKNGEIALFMKNEPLFPGTISPKITLTTKTSVTEQINAITRDDNCTPRDLETKYRPNRMKRVHHAKSTNPECFHERVYRISSNGDGSTNTDSDTDSQLYCQRATKAKDMMDYKSHLKKQCKHCEDMNKIKITRQEKESSNKKKVKATLKVGHKSLDNDEYKNTEITSTKLAKKVNAVFEVGAHHHKCCKSKLTNSSNFNESIRTSNDDSVSEEKSIRGSVHNVQENCTEEPRKINPKIKAHLHLDVYHCKCGMPNSFSNSSRENISHEVNKRENIGDSIKYYLSLKDYYIRLYDGATYQLSRNLKLL